MLTLNRPVWLPLWRPLSLPYPATLSLQAMPAEQDALRFPLLWMHRSMTGTGRETFFSGELSHVKPKTPQDKEGVAFLEDVPEYLVIPPFALLSYLVNGSLDIFPLFLRTLSRPDGSVVFSTKPSRLELKGYGVSLSDALNGCILWKRYFPIILQKSNSFEIDSYLCEGRNKSALKSQECLFHDIDEGTYVHASIHKDFIDQFSNMLKEGKDKDCSELLGITAYDLKTKYAMSKMHVPVEFNQLRNKSMVFKLNLKHDRIRNPAKPIPVLSVMHDEELEAQYCPSIVDDHDELSKMIEEEGDDLEYDSESGDEAISHAMQHDLKLKGVDKPQDEVDTCAIKRCLLDQFSSSQNLKKSKPIMIKGELGSGLGAAMLVAVAWHGDDGGDSLAWQWRLRSSLTDVHGSSGGMPSSIYAFLELLAGEEAQETH
nr:uncharacterized protein LOC109162436 [Ipomoea trifida]